jgi:hypothetical protein
MVDLVDSFFKRRQLSFQILMATLQRLDRL